MATSDLTFPVRSSTVFHLPTGVTVLEGVVAVAALFAGPDDMGIETNK
jgi:hypothetical protein